MSLDAWRKTLDSLRQDGLLRSLKTITGAQQDHVSLDGMEVLLLCSNNYLGLADHPHLIEAQCRAAREYGTGSGASRLVSGSMGPHSELENRLAQFKGTESALLFNAGYAANTGILQGLMGPDDIIFSDSLNHASIIDGCRLSRAKTLVYPHGDLDALESMMVREAPHRRGQWVIVTDGVFSMDGDLAPLPGLVTLKQRYDALLMVDDAHGTGVLGENGKGTAEFLGCLADVDLHMGTLGKALGGFGAFVAGPEILMQYLINRARSFVFSTSLPPGVVAAGTAALDIVESEEGRRRRQRLLALRKQFVENLANTCSVDVHGVTPIIPIITEKPEVTMDASAWLQTQGVFVQGIRPPTVPEGRCRLRVTLMATHQTDHLLRAADLIREVLNL
ncbi:MAG: 8-amino-7-oxononanoate synthase [Desulfuromonadales bacterium]|jgi:glycine C-acetyltransferase/8-amino-7-oxononanoate synthase|nr:8-amino-7-oxononanoate synthase [Desulfuromonadales bacterium]